MSDHKNISSFFTLKPYNEDYVKYEFNNWFEELYHLIFTNLHNYFDHINCSILSPNLTNTQVNLCKIYKKDAAVWLSTTGEIQYRLTKTGAIKTATKSKATTIFAAYCRESFKFVHKDSQNGKVNEEISIYDLMIVEGEKFDPYQQKEFFKMHEKATQKESLGFNNTVHSRDIFFINSFKPSSYLSMKLDNDQKQIPIATSIILQYIYYLANYDQLRFEYILSWIASFFQNLKNKSKTTLVLIGDKQSGVELLYNNILMPLFGEDNCVKISDYNLDIKNQYLLIKDKIFYNLHNLTPKTMEISKNLSFVNNILLDSNIKIETKQQNIIKIPLYGQTLITGNNNVSYLNSTKHDYMIFQVPKNINDISLNKKLQKLKGESSLEDMIKKDLKIFATILKVYNANSKLTIKDDRNQFELTLDEKLNNFHKIILNCSTNELLNKDLQKDVLYEDLNLDFKEKRIKQKNIFLYFQLLYPDEKINSPRTLMVYLRKIDADFYDIKSLINGKDGLKYFLIP